MDILDSGAMVIFRYIEDEPPGEGSRASLVLGP